VSSDFEVVLRQEARRYLKRLDLVTQRRLVQALDELCSDPLKGDIRPLHGQSSVFRLRVGGYRIFFRVQFAKRVIFVEAIGPRGDVYK